MAKRTAKKQVLAGRRIVRVEDRTFSDGRGGLAHDPVVWLDDGSWLTFTVEETDVGEYGVAIVYHPSSR